VGDSDIKMHKE